MISTAQDAPRGHPVLPLIVASLLHALSPTAAPAQSEVKIPTSTCPQCSLSVIVERTIGDSSGPGIIEHQESRVTRDSRGRFYVVGSYSTAVKVFDPGGRYMTSFGVAGAGPGEFEGIAKVLVTPGDSLLVLDNMQMRVSVFTPEYKFVRSTRLEFPPELQTVRLGNGDLVLNVPLYTPARVGQPLHHVTSTGLPRGSFGSESGVFRPDVPYLDRRAIAGAGGTGIWSAHRTSYRIDYYEAMSRRRHMTLVREADWFQPRTAPLGKHTEQVGAPEPFVVNIRQDQQGLLWVLISVADRHWREAVTPPSSTDAHGTVQDDNKYYDTIIEVLNPGNGRLITSQRVDEYITHFVDDRLVAAVTESDRGVPVIKLWRLDLSVR